MKRMLTLVALLGLLAPLQAGVCPSDQQNEGLLPGDNGKPIVIHLLPGGAHDPWQIDDPIIVIDIDGPSDEDEGIIYWSRIGTLPEGEVRLLGGTQ